MIGKATRTMALALATAGSAAGAAGPGLPPITAQTRASGGAIVPEQAALALDHVDLAIEVKPATQTIEAVATLSFTTRDAISVARLDLDRNYAIRSIAVDDSALSRTAWRNPDGRLAITLPRSIGAGERFTVRIAYGGNPHVAVRAPWDGGFVWAKTPSGKPWIATAVQGEGCDLLWPCIDHPTGEPALADLHITVPAGLSAPSNGVLVGIDRKADGRSTWNWRAKHPDTYAIALNIGPYQVVRGSYRSRFGNTIPMEYWYLEGEDDQARKLFAEFAPTLDFFEGTIGPYPFGDEKLGVVETPHLGMEHQTINAYGNAYKRDAYGFDWLFQHEFSHEWFGNQLTNTDWDDMWLHEGFGTYMQPLYGQWRGGDLPYLSMLMKQRATISNKQPVVSGTPKTEEDVYKDDIGPGHDIYYKGSWIAHTLRNLIGDKAFFESVRRLVYGRPDPRPGNFSPRYGSTHEFQRIVNEVTGQDYGWFFDVYLREAALPALVTRQAGDVLVLRWVTPGGKPFPMPIEVQVGDRTTKVAMTGNAGTITVALGEHVTLDPHARVLRRSLDIEELQAWEARQAEAKRAS